jgi:DNA-directed RNA polymerase specialized sigma24 family protein
MFGRSKSAAVRGKEYATRKDFEQVFTESMSGLHLLAYLLTADKTKAEECFVAGLEDSINGNPVFREWARSWSRRSIIKRAISMIQPAPETGNLSLEEPSKSQTAEPDGLTLAASVTSLAPFSRFVFVMAVLEGYSTVECALLLKTTRHRVVNASAEAIRYVASRWPGVSETVANLPTAWKAFFAAA